MARRSARYDRIASPCAGPVHWLTSTGVNVTTGMSEASEQHGLARPRGHRGATRRGGPGRGIRSGPTLGTRRPVLPETITATNRIVTATQSVNPVAAPSAAATMTAAAANRARASHRPGTRAGISHQATGSSPQWYATQPSHRTARSRSRSRG